MENRPAAGSGNPGDYPTLTNLDADHGYIGIPHTLYLTTILGSGADETVAGMQIHMPLAHEIENLQFQYNGDIDNDGFLDGFTDWDPSWTGDIATVQSIRQIRIWILGRTPHSFLSVSGEPPSSWDLDLYRRPEIADSPLGTDQDGRKRFLLESTAAVRNMSLNIYNTDTR